MPFKPGTPHRPQRRQHQPAQGPHTTSEPTTTTPPTESADQLLFTPAEAAQRLRIRESWLRKKAAARTIPCTFLGKHLRFSDADLAAIVAAAARPATGRRTRRKPAPTVRDRDLPPRPPRSVHAHRNDLQSDGSSPWHG